MGQITLLLADDEKVILDSFYRELKSDVLEVTLATTGEEAVNMINTNRFDIVVTDLLLPVVDGLQVLKAAKNKDVRTIVIILTGHGDVESAVDALRLGADDFLRKPCDPNELLYRVSNCLAKQEMQRKNVVGESTLPICRKCKKILDH
jgi:DNA-binding NtrC family response regulator